jgi:predicted O-methyltransferase YrrM
MSLFNMRPHRFKTGLENLIKFLPENIVMAELGSYAGESSVMFAKKVNKIYCIDAWFDADSEVKFNSVISVYNNIEKIKGRVEEEYKRFSDGFFDFVYIDADHSYEAVKMNIKEWGPKIKDGGLIGGHDYSHKFWPGVVRAVDEMFVGKNVIFFEDSSWITGKGTDLP